MWRFVPSIYTSHSLGLQGTDHNSRMPYVNRRNELKSEGMSFVNRGNELQIRGNE